MSVVGTQVLCHKPCVTSSDSGLLQLKVHIGMEIGAFQSSQEVCLVVTVCSCSMQAF